VSGVNSLHPFRCAMQGLAEALSTQRHLRIHIVAAGLVVLCGLLLGLPSGDLALLLMAIALVIITELLNTAVELSVDLASPAAHPIAGRAKDIAAGAVLIAALVASAVGIIILAPPLLRTLVASPLSAKSAVLAGAAIGLAGSLVTALLPHPPPSKAGRHSAIGNTLHADR